MSEEGLNQYTWYTMSESFFRDSSIDSDETEFSDELIEVDLSLVDSRFTNGLTNFGSYFFPEIVIHGVRSALNKMEQGFSSVHFGNLVYLFFMLDQKIRSIRFPSSTSLNPEFERERKKLFHLLDLIEQSDTSLLSVNIKLDKVTAKDDALFKDKDVLQYLKQLLMTGVHRARNTETLGHYNKAELEAIQKMTPYKARGTSLPLKKEDFILYYNEISKCLKIWNL